MENDTKVLDILLRIERTQGEIRGELVGLRNEQQRAANEMVRVWENTSDIETRVTATEKRFERILGWAAGAGGTVGFVAAALREWMGQ